MSPREEDPDSSWLEKAREESREEDWSEEEARMEAEPEAEDVDVDGEKESGEKPNSLKYGWSSASCAVMRCSGLKHSIFCTYIGKRGGGRERERELQRGKPALAFACPVIPGAWGTHPDEILGVLVHLRDDVPPPPGRGGLEVGPGDGCLLRPVLLRRGAHHIKHLLQLVHLVVPGKEGLPQEQLGEDAAAGPDVHGRGVGQPHQDLGTPVPQGDHHRGEEGVELVDPGQPEVGQLDVAIPGDQEVLRLQVPVDDPVAVEEVHPTQDLPDDVLIKTERRDEEERGH